MFWNRPNSTFHCFCSFSCMCSTKVMDPVHWSEVAERLDAFISRSRQVALIFKSISLRSWARWIFLLVVPVLDFVHPNKGLIRLCVNDGFPCNPLHSMNLLKSIIKNVQDVTLPTCWYERQWRDADTRWKWRACLGDGSALNKTLSVSSGVSNICLMGDWYSSGLMKLYSGRCGRPVYGYSKKANRCS